jgi:predicted RNase H-like HicB family nuclease
MSRTFTLEYWPDGGGFVGRLKEYPGVLSEGDTLEELQENIRDAYQLMAEDDAADARPDAQTMEIVL